MHYRMQRKIATLKRDIRSLGNLVGRRVEEAIQAILARDIGLAAAVIAGDKEVDIAEVELEEACLAALFLDQPVASDLRFIVAVMKINNDLERIGDLAVSIAEQSRALVELNASQDVPFDLEGETRVVTGMLQMSLEAIVHIDAELAE